MKTSLKKSLKVFLQIFLIVFSIFSISNIKVSAQTTEKGCCEKTKSGEYCLYTEESNCDSNSHFTNAACEQTSYCQLGCCYDSDEGRCYKGTAKAVCRNKENSTWQDSQNCEISQCQTGCCILSDQCSLVTQTRCKKEASQYPNLPMQFKQDITSETECVNQCRNAEEGCCVQEDGACTFTTRGACSSTSSGNSSIGFHKDMLCSNDALPCDCAKQQYTGCLGNKDEVYWFDSCNNRENIYSSDKLASYNRGYVLPKEKSCKLTNPNDPNCGNCDYTTGTLCGQASKDTRVQYGEYVCKDLNCKNVYENTASPSSGSDKKSGESWCLYDAAVGYGKDVVGSRHYRSLCINGEELSEPCEDYRRQICIQGILGAAPSELGESFKVTGSYIEAACRTNRWADCTSCTTADCCNDISIRDCYWMPAGVTTTGGTCVPHVPPGLKFWEGESQSQTPGEDATSICEKASMQCAVTWERGGMSKIGLGSKDWKCIKNCHCLKKDYIVAANDYCKALGDCGAYYNIAGKATLEGFSQDTENTFTKADVGDWETLVEPSKAKESEFSFQSTWKRSLGFTLAIAGISGLYTLSDDKGWSGLLAGGRGISALFKGIWPKTWKSGGVLKTMSDAALKTYGGEKITVKVGESLLDKAVTDAQVTISKGSVVPKGFVSDKSINLINEKSGTYLLDQGKKFEADQILRTPEAIAGKYNGLGTEGMTAAKDLATTTTQPSTLAKFATWFQTIMWIYTIYNILDWLLKDTKTKTYTIKCQPWQAPIGGSDCEKCQEEGKTCSEYRCKSLGKLCSLVNVGTPQEKCVNLHPNDVTAPIITPNKAALSRDYSLTETTTPGHRGYTITPKIKPFTPVSVGINVNEPSQCKFALNTSIKFEDMQFDFGDSLFLYNHTMLFSLPSDLATDQALRLTNNGQYTLYVKCKDASGNTNKDDYFVKFAIEPGPDLTPPVIELTSILNNAPVPAGINSTALSIYINEPATCSWSNTDIEYENMKDYFTCTSSFSSESVYYGLYECKTLLTGIKDNFLNSFFFRCKDKPTATERERNVMTDSYKFNLIGTIPLRILSTSPSGQLFNDTPLLTVTTADGAERGIALCGYSETNVPISNMIQFLNTNSIIHTQPLSNLSGSYNYLINCIDIAGNIANSSTSFTVVTAPPPKIINVYKDLQLNLLYLTLDQPSNCKYSNLDFNYDTEGIIMPYSASTDHQATLENNIYHIRCRNIYNSNEMHAIVYP